MRKFNTSGPCNPALHYTVMREALIANGKEKVNEGRYITLFAPRQSGKTTYFQLLLEELKDDYVPIWISFEGLNTMTREEFYESFDYDMHFALSEVDIHCDVTIKNQLTVRYFFRDMRKQNRPIVLVIDEFEGIPNAVLGEVMHTFRKIYHQKERYNLHALILVGVSTIAELVLSTASPFNVAEELQLPYFTDEEVRDLIGQYVAESKQPFDEEVIAAIIHNTNGQPGLVCALCHHLVTEVVPDRSQPVTMDAWYPTLNYFLTRRNDMNIANVIEKARQKESFMLRVLFNEQPLPFSVDVPDMAWLYAHGVIDVIDGSVGIAVPLYAKRLVRAFAPVINGEMKHYLTSLQDTFSEYVHPDGRLNVHALLQEYRAYVRRRGHQAFDTENLREAACHYSLDGFIAFFIQEIGGTTFIEIPSGRGRIDLLIRYGTHSYLIETKVFSSLTAFERGKGQLAAYLQSERRDEGYYVVFSALHTDDDTLETDEVIDGKRIYTHIILTNFERPSRLGVRCEV